MLKIATRNDKLVSCLIICKLELIFYMKLLSVMLVIFTLLLSACTPYQKNQSFSLIGGGYVDSVTGKMTKVEFFGNGYTSSKKAELYVLRRISELAKTKNAKYVSIYKSITDATNNIKSNEPFRSTTESHSYAYVIFKNEKSSGDLSIEEINSIYTTENK